MIHRLEIYLNQVMAYANLPQAQAESTRNELTDHLLERIDEFEKQGATRDDAVFRAIHDHGRPSDIGYGLRGGFPLIDVRLRGTARGFIAVGPKAVGVFACGIISTGVMSCGVLSFGLFSLGLIAVGLFFGFGCVSGAFFSIGMTAIGIIAVGFNSLGVISSGLNAAGLWVFNGVNTASFFTEKTAPDFFLYIGHLCELNAVEVGVSMLPLVAVVGIHLIVSTVLAAREKQRVVGCKSWAFE